jgi:hypothetical protein
MKPAHGLVVVVLLLVSVMLALLASIEVPVRAKQTEIDTPEHHLAPATQQETPIPADDGPRAYRSPSV